MKSLNLSICAGVAIILANTNVYAGALLKELATTEVGEMANLSSMTRTGLTEYQGFKAAVEGTAKGNWYSWLEKRMVIFTPKNEATSGVIQQIEVAENGTITRTAFNLPPSANIHSTLELTNIEAKPGVVRTSDTIAGAVKVKQIYNVKPVSGRPLRVQYTEDVRTSTVHASATMIDDRLVLNIKPEGQLNHHLKFKLADDGIAGEIVNFSFKPHENRLVIHVAEGSDITEYIYNLRLAPGGEFGRTVVPTRVGMARLAAAEIKNLGLLAEMKVIPGRVVASAPARGMEVVGQGVAR